jgi:prephenate dehydrogenase
VRSRRTDEAAWTLVERLVRRLGAQPREVDARVHDRVVGITSHLPTLLAVAMTEIAVELRAEVVDGFLAGPGLGSAIRLAGSEPEMTAQMLGDNADEVDSAVITMIERLEDLRRTLSGERSKLRARLAAARSARSTTLSDGRRNVSTETGTSGAGR